MDIKTSYSFNEIIEYQKRPLNEKVEFAVEVLRRAATLTRGHNAAIAFSGGKDSLVVADLIERFVPELHERIYCIFGNTGCEFPESLNFARKYGVGHYGERFKETRPLPLEQDELRYEFARELIQRLEVEGALGEVLKDDGKLKGQAALIAAAKRRGYVLERKNCFFKGEPMSFAYCIEQYGAPLLGKAASKLDAHRINIECFLKYSNTATDDPKLKEYYGALRECKFSQHCCKLLKKEPSERMQAELDVAVIIKGLMASESHTRMVNVSSRGPIFASKRKHIKDGAFYHISPLCFFTDEDIWEYIRQYNLEYSPLYDITYEDENGDTKRIARNGCMFCGTDIQFKDNHLSVLRKTHPRAYHTAMEHFGYREQLNALFRRYKNPNILSAATDVGKSARIIEQVGEHAEIANVRPCAYDDIGEMVDLAGTGLDTEYDAESDDESCCPYCGKPLENGRRCACKGSRAAFAGELYDRYYRKGGSDAVD